MKVIFLDIDGVLNKTGTKERLVASEGLLVDGVVGIDARLRDLFLGWLAERPDVHVILSSTWRYLNETRDELVRNGLHWVAETPAPGQLNGTYRKGIRGEEIEVILSKPSLSPFITNYAILDDLGPLAFLKHQRRFLVQTSERFGLQKKHLNMLDRMLFPEKAVDKSCTPV
jgi:hypothetical protein